MTAGAPPHPELSRLTGPGGEFEIAQEDVLGVSMPVFRGRYRHLGALLEDSAQHGTADYLVTAERRISFTEHLRAVRSVAAALAARGVRSGDRVAIMAANCPEWIVTFWAAASLGAVTAAFNAWWTPREVEWALGHAEPVLLVADADRAERVPPGAVPVVRTDEVRDMMTAHPQARAQPVRVDEDDPAVIVYTSGTTGRSKGAVHSHRNVLATVDYHRLQEVLAASMTAAPARRRHLMSMPLFHIASLHNMALPRLATGATIVIHEGSFDPARVLALVERERVTNWTVVPTMASRLLDHDDFDSYDLSALRSFSLASAPSSEALKQRLRAALPAADSALVDSYGLTESCTGATVATPQQLREHPGTVGSPVPGMDVQIRDADGMVLPGGAEGEIWVRGAYVMLGYWRDPDADAGVFDEQRWMRTGDIGRLVDGRLHLAARRSDLILRGGENVYPVEVEHCLDEHPEVRESAVLGVDHPDLGQEVGAVVVAERPDKLDTADLAEFVRQRLAYYKVPSRWRVTAEPLPRNATGKVNRNELKL